MTDTLRDEIAREVGEAWLSASWSQSLLLADAILAIPRLQEALTISAGFSEGDFRDYLLRRGRWAERTDEMGYV